MKENLSTFLELIRVFRGEILTGTTFRTFLIYFRMTLEIVFQAFSYIFSLRNDTHTRFGIFKNLRHQERIMRTSQDDGINIGVSAHQLIHPLLDKIISSGTIRFIVFNKRNPKRTCYATDLHIRPELSNLQIIAFTFDSSFCGKQANMIVSGQFPDQFCCRTNNTKNPSLRIQLRYVTLLY